LAAERGQFDLVLSESILNELREKLIAKFAYSPADAALAAAPATDIFWRSCTWPESKSLGQESSCDGCLQRREPTDWRMEH